MLIVSIELISQSLPSPEEENRTKPEMSGLGQHFVTSAANGTHLRLFKIGFTSNGTILNLKIMLLQKWQFKRKLYMDQICPI